MSNTNPVVPEELRETVTLSSLDLMIDALGQVLSPVLSPNSQPGPLELRLAFNFRHFLLRY